MRLLEAQNTLLEIVIDLQRLDHRLRALQSTLHLPPKHDQMARGHLPTRAVAEVHNTIEYVLAMILPPAIDYLSSATKVTDKELRLQFLRDADPHRALASLEPAVGKPPAAQPAPTESTPGGATPGDEGA